VEIASTALIARGHPLIRATHRSTFEITMDSYLTPRGDCIVGVSASASPKSLPEELREALRRDSAVVVIELRSGRFRDVVLCRGSKRLTLASDRKIIVRRSRYVDDATLCIESNKAARDLDRGLISALQEGAVLTVKIFVVQVPYLETVGEALWKNCGVRR